MILFSKTSILPWLMPNISGHLCWNCRAVLLTEENVREAFLYFQPLSCVNHFKHLILRQPNSDLIYCAPDYQNVKREPDYQNESNTTLSSPAYSFKWGKLPLNDIKSAGLHFSRYL